MISLFALAAEHLVVAQLRFIHADSKEPTVPTITADFVFSNHGSIVLVTPQNTSAHDNLRAGVSDEAQWFAGGVAVEPRYVESLAAQLTDEGFSASFE